MPSTHAQHPTFKHRQRRLLATGALGAIVFGACLNFGPAQAQQSYFRGEAQPGDSVIVNLSVIDRLREGSGAANAMPRLPTPMPAPTPAPAPSASEGVPVPMTSAPQASAGGLAEPPSSMPQSSLNVSGSSNTQSAEPPPPQPSVAPRPAPAPAPVPAPAPAAAEPEPPQAEPEPETDTASALPEPVPVPSNDAPEMAGTDDSGTSTEQTSQEAMAATEEPAPAPEAAPTSDETAEAATNGTPSTSVDVASLTPAGVFENDDGLTIVFHSSSQDLPESAEPALDALAQELIDDPAKSLRLLGYSEAVDGTPSRPRRMSLFRALAVRTHLIGAGIDSRRMTVQALGARDEGNGRPDNRVDVIVSRN